MIAPIGLERGGGGTCRPVAFDVMRTAVVGHAEGLYGPWPRSDSAHRLCGSESGEVTKTPEKESLVRQVSTRQLWDLNYYSSRRGILLWYTLFITYTEHCTDNSCRCSAVRCL